MSNYATDLFMPIFDEIQRLTGARTYTDKVQSVFLMFFLVLCMPCFPHGCCCTNKVQRHRYCSVTVCNL